MGVWNITLTHVPGVLMYPNVSFNELAKFQYT